MPCICLYGPICLDAPVCLDTPTYVWMLLVCFDDVWMPPVHAQYKESMLSQTKGVSICLNTFGCPPYVWMPSLYVWMTPYVWTPQHMFGCPLYVLISPMCLDTPIYLDAPLYVWMMFGCLFYIYNTRKACIVRLRGCPYAPICWVHLCMFGCSLYAWVLPYVWMHPLYVWMSPYVWMAACMFGHPHMFGCPLYT